MFVGTRGAGGGLGAEKRVFGGSELGDGGGRFLFVGDEQREGRGALGEDEVQRVFGGAGNDRGGIFGEVRAMGGGEIGGRGGGEGQLEATHTLLLAVGRFFLGEALTRLRKLGGGGGGGFVGLGLR